MNKLLLTTAMLFSMASFGQPCSDLIESTMGGGYKSTKKMIYLTRDRTSKTGIIITSISSIMAFPESVSISGGVVINGKEPCFETNGEVDIIFRDGTKIALETKDDPNCKGNFQFFVGVDDLTNIYLVMLQEKEIESIRVWYKSGYIEEKFTRLQSSTFKEYFNCILKAWD